MTNARFLALAVLLIATGAAGVKEARAEDGATAPEQAPAATPFRYVLGAAVSSHPDGVGSREYKTSPSLLWAIRWGRWRISSGGASALFGFGREVAGSGASTELIDSKLWRVGVSLRIDSGRKSSDAGTTTGLPDIRRTLRGRLFSSYALSPDWQLSGSLSQDLLGRDGGLLAGMDLGWRLRRSESTEWTAGVGIAAADARQMRSYFGVTPEASLSSGLMPFTPSAGLSDVHAGIGFTHALSRRWVAFGSAGVSRLIGPAARSPLTQSPTGGQVGLGLAYRN